MLQVSLISKLASKNLHEPLQTYYLGYEDKEDIFEDLAEYVAKNINSSHTKESEQNQYLLVDRFYRLFF